MNKLQIFCARQKPNLATMIHDGKSYSLTDKEHWYWKLNGFEVIPTYLNGLVVAECDFEIEPIKFCHIKERDKFGILHNESWFEYKGINIGSDDCDLGKKSCMSEYDFDDYLINKDAYAIVLTGIRIYRLPKHMSEFGIPSKRCNHLQYCNNGDFAIRLPSEVVCRILNGEQTIIVKKKILKGMLNVGR